MYLSFEPLTLQFHRKVLYRTDFFYCVPIYILYGVVGGGEYFRYSEDKIVILFLESILLHLLCIPYMYTYNKHHFRFLFGK